MLRLKSSHHRPTARFGRKFLLYFWGLRRKHRAGFPAAPRASCLPAPALHARALTGPGNNPRTWPVQLSGPEGMIDCICAAKIVAKTRAPVRQAHRLSANPLPRQPSSLLKTARDPVDRHASTPESFFGHCLRTSPRHALWSRVAVR